MRRARDRISEEIMSNVKRNIWLSMSAAILAATIGCAATAPQPQTPPPPKEESTGQYIDDTVITSRVKAALVADPATKASQVNVETFKGVVQLSGFVESQAMANKAVELARSVKGVASVKNDMRVR
jgi:osmotically-inducible protein OsmY